jgi:hypothetical protein
VDLSIGSFRLAENRSDRELFEEFLRVVSRRQLGHREAAAAIGTSPSNLTRLRNEDWQRLQPRTRRGIANFIEGESGDGSPTVPEDVLQVFGDIERITRFIEGIAPPGQKEGVKLEALEGYRRMITARQPLPDWWPELYSRVKNGEL